MRDPTAQRLAQEAYKALQTGELLLAETLTKQALAKSKRNGDALAIMGILAYQRSRYREAADWQRKAIATNRKEPLYHCNLGKALAQGGDLTPAMAAFEKALRLQPGHVEATVGKASVWERRGKVDRARALLEPFIKSRQITAEVAAVYSRILAREGKHEEVVEFTEQQLDQPYIRDVQRREMLLQLGTSYHRLGDYDHAFEAYVKGNKVSARPYDVGITEMGFNGLMAAFSPELMAGMSRAPHDSELPVFVVGLPRCGSTLTEQIIHAHPEALGAGEVNYLQTVLPLISEEVDSGEPYPECMSEASPENLDRLAKAYLDKLRIHSHKARRIADKTLGNFQHVGLISVMLPQARIIHVRRHPLDVCFSCFFANLSPVSHPFAGDLRDLGLYYRWYSRLMDHWRSLPDVNMLEIDYEALVADQENLSRKIIDFIGLPWHDNCLRFHEAKRAVATLSYDQVRKPMYKTAVARYKLYDKHLGPLKDALGDLLPPEDA
ncbi:MAG: sulfotransferase [Phycisphaerales bacterium]|nr:MAG: sulfotransferase [Phycisphaerales bacterium]